MKMADTLSPPTGTGGTGAGRKATTPKGPTRSVPLTGPDLGPLPFFDTVSSGGVTP